MKARKMFVIVLHSARPFGEGLPLPEEDNRKGTWLARYDIKEYNVKTLEPVENGCLITRYNESRLCKSKEIAEGELLETARHIQDVMVSLDYLCYLLETDDPRKACSDEWLGALRLERKWKEENEEKRATIKAQIEALKTSLLYI